MNLKKVFKQSKDIASNVVDGEAVLVESSEGSIKVLNETASLIWAKIDGVKTVEEIISEVVTVFNVDYQTAQTDCLEFLNELLKKRYID